jgi:hypothetical protein
MKGILSSVNLSVMLLYPPTAYIPAPLIACQLEHSANDLEQNFGCQLLEDGRGI